MKRIAAMLALLCIMVSLPAAYAGTTRYRTGSHAKTYSTARVSQAVRIMAGASIQHRTVANIPAQRMPIIGTAITRTGGLPTDTAFTSHPEKMGSGCPSLR